MLNKVALEAAYEAGGAALRGPTTDENVTVFEAAIEAYLAALPDEGEIVAILRQRCGDIGVIMARDGAVDPRIDKNLMGRAIDALEATRAKPSAPTIIGMLDESGDVITTEAMLAVLKREGWVEISPGYRLVPEPEPKPSPHRR